MPFQQWLLLNVPTAVIGLVMLAIAVATAVGGVLLVRRFFSVEMLKGHHDVAVPIYATLGVVYAVMLSYVLIIVWQNFDRTQNGVVAEANKYAGIMRDCEGLAEPFRSEMRNAMTTYLDAVVDEEWNLMASGERSVRVQQLTAEVWKLYGSYNPSTDSEKIFYAAILDRMNEAGELRRQRVLDAQTGIHPMLWFVLLLGGIITVVFSFFFGSENLAAQLIMTVLLSVMIALILFTILIMDFPFSGDMGIKPDSFLEVLKYIKG